MKLNFSSNEVRNIFAENDYAEYSQLMFDTAKGEEKVSTKDANNKIREIMFSVPVSYTHLTLPTTPYV